MTPPGIGLLNEKPLHAALKQWYAEPGDQQEVPVDGYVIDLVRGPLLIEIQTGSFSPLRAKLTRLVESHPIRLLYPIAQEKWIVKPEEGDPPSPSRRKSPKRGRLEDLFWELVAFPHLLSHPNFSCEVLMIQEEEARRFDSRRMWRRKGWVTAERRLLAVVGRRLFAGLADWRALVPASFDGFTARELATSLGIRIELAQKMAYCLQKSGAAEYLGKQGRARRYALLPTMDGR